MKAISVFKKAAIPTLVLLLVIAMTVSIIPMVSADDASAPQIVSNTLAISGDISLVTYFTPTDLADTDYVTVSVPKQGGGVNTIKTTVAELNASKAANNGRWAVKAPLAAAQLTDTVTIKWYKGGKAIATYERCAKTDYIDKVFAAAETNAAYAPLLAPLKSILNYGALAQTQFNYNTGKPANEGLYVDANPIDGMTAENLYDAKAGEFTSTENIKFIGAQAYLQSAVRLSVYFNAPEGATVQISDGNKTQQVHVNKDSNGYYVNINNIASFNFDKVYTIEVTYKDETATAKYSVLGYALNVVDSYKITDSRQKDTAKALYHFYTFTKAYTNKSYTPGPASCTHARTHTEGISIICSDCGKNAAPAIAKVTLKSDTVALYAGETKEVSFTLSVSGQLDLSTLIVTLKPNSDKLTLTYVSNSEQFATSDLLGAVGVNVVMSAGSALTEHCELVTITYTVNASESGIYKISPQIREALNGTGADVTSGFTYSYAVLEAANRSCICGDPTGYNVTEGKHRAYCDTCRTMGTWENHTAGQWTIDTTDPQYEKANCSVCGEALSRIATVNQEGLHIFDYQLIKNKAGTSANAQLMTDGPGGMSYVRLTPIDTSSNKTIYLHQNTTNTINNVGSYVAILYRTSVNQKFKISCTTLGGHTTTTLQDVDSAASANEWSYIIHKYNSHDNYDGTKLATFSFLPFTVARALTDYTDVAFIAFFSSYEEAWNYLGTYATAYNFRAEDFAHQYHSNLNGGDTLIDGKKIAASATVSINKPATLDCSSLPLASADKSLQLYGWCATPGGIKEYGYYVVDGDTKSEYKFLINGSNSTNPDLLNQVSKYNFPSSISNGLLMGNGIPKPIVSLAGYGGKTVNVIYVAKTNWGAELELAHFNNVIVPDTQLVDFIVEVPEGREPVILQLTDTQIIYSTGTGKWDFWAADKMDVECFDYITEIVNATNPDLILLTGDMVYGMYDNNGTSFEALIELMEGFDIPWAPVFGNHEAESAKGIDWQCAQLEAAENCLFLQRELTGNGNYSVGIKQGDQLTRVFFMLDSNGCNSPSAESQTNTHLKNNSGFGADQIAWYTAAINNIKAASPETKISLAFHIPLQAMIDSFATYTEGNGTAFIDRLENKNEGDFGYIGSERDSVIDKDYAIWNAIKALGVDSVFAGHMHTHSASIVYEGVRLQFGMKSSTYDKINYIDANGNITEEYHATGKTPWVGGSVMKLSPEGTIGDAYVYYCENAGGNIDWDSFEKCDHSANTAAWQVKANDPQYETSVCSACGEALTRFVSANTDGLLLFNPERIHTYHDENGVGEIMTENGMSYVRLNPTKTSGSEYILLHANKEKPFTNVGKYIAILYRSNLNQQLITACVTGSNTVIGSAPHWTTNPLNTGNWSFIIQEYKDHADYDKKNLHTFALYPFTVARTESDYTDVAFVSFFDSIEDAWEYYSLYTKAYNVPAQYYFNINGNSNIDNTSFGTIGTTRNKAVTLDCASRTLTTTTSLRFGGWFTTPGGIKEYGFYVVDGDSKSSYTKLGTGTNLNPTDFANNVQPYLHFFDTYGSGANVAPTNSTTGAKGLPIDLSAYAGKTVKVIAVAKTNFGDEIELVYFTNVTVPCDHSNSTSAWEIDTTAPQYAKITCSVCGETIRKLADETDKGSILFNYEFINNKTPQDKIYSEIKTDGPGGMSYVRFTPINEKDNKNAPLHANASKPLTNVGSYVAILYRTSVEQDFKYACDSTAIATRGGIQTIDMTKSATQWRFSIVKIASNQYYDGTTMSLFTILPFTASRTMTDYTDIAFIAFFDTEEDAKEFFDLYEEAYGITDNLSVEYCFGINGNTNLEGTTANRFYAGTVAYRDYDCSAKTLQTAKSLHFGGWFATPGGISEYGYYVVDSGNISNYNYLVKGVDGGPSLLSGSINVNGRNWDDSCLKGAVVATINSKPGAPIDLTAYAGKKVTVIVVAKTNFGDEIELVYFTNVTVPKS